MQDNLSLSEVQKEWHGTYKHYVIGLILSVVLSGLAFFLVMAGVVTGLVLIYTLVGLAVLQAIGQLLFFLHVGNEEKPRWETGVLLFMALVAATIIVGTLWIMFDLNNRTMDGMSPHKEFPPVETPQNVPQ